MKKTLAIGLVIALTLCMAVVGFAQSTSSKITGMTQGLTLGYSGSTDLGDVYPQDERVEYIYLYDSMFTWDDGTALAATPTQLTASQIRAAKLDARSTKSTSKVLDGVTLNARESRIEVKFAKEYVGTKDLDFDFDVVLTIDGRRQSDHAINFSGTFCNQVVDVYDGDSAIDISDGSVAHAQEYISKLRLDIGHGVTVETRLSKDKKVYGTTTMSPDRTDDECMKEYKDIVEVITLRTAGIGIGVTVRLSAEYGDYHIYGKDMKYLGKGNEELEFSEKYYLAAKKLDVSEDDVSEAPTPTTTPEVTESAASSATEEPDNVNNNPNTGR